MRAISIILFLIFLSGFNNIWAQGESAVPFVLIQPSTQLNGMAGAYTALPTNDTFGSYYNPAQLGYFSQNDNLSHQIMETKWLPTFNFDDLYFKAKGFQLGYNLKNIKSSIPVSIGVGYMRGYLNLGENVWTDETGTEIGTFDSKEWYDAFSIGIKYSYFADFSIGITYKFIKSKLTPGSITINDSKTKSVAETEAYDLGFLFSLPIHKFYANSFMRIPGNEFNLLPLTRFSVGMVKTNVGDAISYLDPNQPDPLPRQAKIGYSIDLGLSADWHNIQLDIFNYQHSSEANDLLVKRDTSGRFEYQSFPGDININDNVFDKNGNSLVINRNGYSIEFLELVKISRGKFHGHGFSKIRTSGYTLHLKGLLKVITSLFPSPYVKRILPHFDLMYSQSKYNPKEDDHPLSKTKFESITISVYGF